MSPLRAELEAICGPGATAEREVRDLWPLGILRARAGLAGSAAVVVRPREAGEVPRVLAAARRHGAAVLPLGAATGVLGAASASEGDVALDLTGLDRIIDVDAENLTCRVEAGVVGMRLEEHLNRLGLTLGHFPSSLPVSTVGGLVSTRSSGQESTYYGSIEDLLLGVRVFLPDGTELHPLPGPRSAVGPALHQLYAGAEGSLGVIVEVVLKVSRLPAEVVGGGYRVADVESGLAAMRAVAQSGLRPLVMRLYDEEDTIFQGAGVDGCLLVLGFAGPAGVASAAAAAAAAMVGGDPLGPAPFERWSEHRFSLSAERLQDMLASPGSIVDTIEVAAPWTHLGRLHAEVKAELARVGIALCHFSHAYPQGCCAYFSFAGSRPSEAEARQALEDAWAAVMEICLRSGATISHHHGIGQARAPYARRELGGWWDLWARVRSAVDPGRLMRSAGAPG